MAELKLIGSYRLTQNTIQSGNAFTRELDSSGWWIAKGYCWTLHGLAVFESRLQPNPSKESLTYIEFTYNGKRWKCWLHEHFYNKREAFTKVRQSIEKLIARTIEKENPA